MKKFFIAVLLVTMVIASSFALDMKGAWTIEANVNGQTVLLDVTIVSHAPESGDFIGYLHDSAPTVTRTIQGRIIKASGLYSQDLIEFTRVDPVAGKEFIQLFIGQVRNDNLIDQGHFVDTYGNSATFSMYR